MLMTQYTRIYSNCEVRTRKCRVTFCKFCIDNPKITLRAVEVTLEKLGVDISTSKRIRNKWQKRIRELNHKKILYDAKLNEMLPKVICTNSDICKSNQEDCGHIGSHVRKGQSCKMICGAAEPGHKCKEIE